MPVALVRRSTGTKVNVAVALLVNAPLVFVVDKFLGDAPGTEKKTASDRYARNKVVSDACIRNLREKANIEVSEGTVSMKNTWVFSHVGNPKTGRERLNNRR